MKVISTPHNNVPVGEMQDGQIAVIENWGKTSGYLGRIIQRHAKSLISLGAKCENSWGTTWNDDGTCKIKDPECMVKILPAGSIIEI